MWNSAGTDLKEYANEIRSQADTFRNAVHDLGEPGRWVGAGQKGAESRANSDRNEIIRLCDKLEDAGVALETGGKLIGENRTSVLNTVRALEEDEFSVSDDWTVTDISRLSQKDDLTPTEDATLKSREQRAKNDQASLRSIADTLGADDYTYGDKISKAFAAAAPVLDAVASGSGEQADHDFWGLMSGRATPEQLRRFRAMATLSPQQLSELAAGNDAVIPSGQMDYLRRIIALADKQGGLSGITTFGMFNTDVRYGMANALQIVSNPKVRTNQFTERIGWLPFSVSDIPGTSPIYNSGGLHQLPSSIIEVLSPEARKTRTIGSDQNPSIVSGYKTDIVDVSRIDDLTKVCDLISNGDPRLRLGTGIDRTLIERSGDLAGIVKDYGEASSREHRTQMTEGLDPIPIDVSREEMLDQLDAIVSVAGSDRMAVHDVIVSGSSGSGQGMTSLLTVDWDDSKHHGVENMVRWMGDSDIAATHPGDSAVHAHQARLAGESATELARIAAEHSKEFVDNPHHNDGAIGAYNPGVTRAMADGLSPHFGTMVGADPALFGTAGGTQLGSQDEMSKVFQVLDSDPEAASTANTRGIDAIERMQYQFAAGTGVENGVMGQYSGRMSIAMEDGLNLATADMNDEARHDAANAYAENGVKYDTAKSVLSAFLGPLSGTASSVLDIANPTLKAEILGPAPWSADITSDQADQLQAHQGERIEASKGRNVATYVNLLNGVHQNNPHIFDDPDLQQFVTDGKLNLNTIANKQHIFMHAAGVALGDTEERYNDSYDRAADNRLKW